MGTTLTQSNPPPEPSKQDRLKQLTALRQTWQGYLETLKGNIDDLTTEILDLLGDEKEVLELDDGSRLRVTPVRPEKTIYHRDKMPPEIYAEIVVEKEIPATVEYVVDETRLLGMLKGGQITSEQVAEFVEFKPIKPSIRLSVPKDEEEDAGDTATIHDLVSARRQRGGIVLEEED